MKTGVDAAEGRGGNAFLPLYVNDWRPHNAETPDWKPLEDAIEAAGLPAATVDEFMWMYEDPAGIHHYKHRETRQYAHLPTQAKMTGDAIAQVAFARTRKG